MLEVLMKTPLDRRGDPLHQQLRDRIERLIISHTYEPGTPLPTEQELQVNLEISRSVVRQALASLAEHGLIERKRGRGSIIARPRSLHRQAERAGGFDQDILAQGGTVQTKVLSLRRVTLDGHEATILGATEAWELERIRLVEEKAVIFMRTWFACQRFSTPSIKKLTNTSLLEWMKAQGYEPTGGARHLQAVGAGALQSKHLEIAEGTPLMLLEGVTEDTSGLVLERFNVWHVPQTIFDVDARVRFGGEREKTLSNIKQVLADAQMMLDRL